MFVGMALLSAVSIFALVVLLWMISLNRFSFLSGTVVDPFVFVFLLLLFFNIDFWVLAADSSSMQMFERVATEASSDILYAYFVFVLYQTVLIFSFFVSSGKRIKSRGGLACQVLPLKDKSPFFVLSSVLLAGVYFGSQLLSDLGSILAAEVSRQYYFKDNQLLHLVFLFVCPAYSLYLSRKQSIESSSFLLLFGLVGFLFLSGSRGSILLLFVVFGVYFSLLKRRISCKMLFGVIPVVIWGLILMRYYFREAWRYDSVWDFIDSYGGVAAVFFRSAEVSMAEVLTMVVANASAFDIYPFQGLLGFLTYPIPRSIFTLKPLSASGYFTDYVSSDRWETSRSELLVGGFGNAYMEFGLIFGALVVFFLGYWWVRALRVSLLGDRKMIFYVPFLIWLSYMFLRGDFFNMGSTSWSVVLVLLIGKVFDFFLRLRVHK